MVIFSNSMFVQTREIFKEFLVEKSYIDTSSEACINISINTQQRSFTVHVTDAELPYKTILEVLKICFPENKPIEQFYSGKGNSGYLEGYYR